MNHPPKSKQQFRPYLTSSELAHLLTLLTLSSEKGVPESSNLLKKLKLFAFKIQNDLVNPASTLSLTPRSSPHSLESLGSSIQETRYLSGEMTPDEEAEYLSKLMNSTGA
jgi:hypothetical protein